MASESKGSSPEWLTRGCNRGRLWFGGDVDRVELVAGDRAGPGEVEDSRLIPRARETAAVVLLGERSSGRPTSDVRLAREKTRSQ